MLTRPDTVRDWTKQISSGTLLHLLHTTLLSPMAAGYKLGHWEHESEGF